MTSFPPPGFHNPNGRPEPSETPASDQTEPGARRWKPWFGIAALIVGFGATACVAAVIIVGAGAFGASTTDPPPGVNIALMIVQSFALLGAAYLFANFSGRPTATDFGLRPAPLGRSIGLIVAVWVGFWIVSAVWVGVLGLDEQQELPDRLGADGPLPSALVVVALVTVVAPLWEELFFRGFFFGSLRTWRGPWPAAILTGLVFGAIHAGSSPIGYLVPLALFGVGLCLLYHYSGSLYPCIALHALNNSIALGVSQKWYWQIPVMMVCSVIASLAIAWWLARLLGDERPAAPAPAPAPA